MNRDEAWKAFKEGRRSLKGEFDSVQEMYDAADMAGIDAILALIDQARPVSVTGKALSEVLASALSDAVSVGEQAAQTIGSDPGDDVADWINNRANQLAASIAEVSHD